MLKRRLTGSAFVKLLKENNIPLSVFAYKTKTNLTELKALKASDKPIPAKVSRYLAIYFRDQLPADAIVEFG